LNPGCHCKRSESWASFIAICGAKVVSGTKLNRPVTVGALGALDGRLSPSTLESKCLSLRVSALERISASCSVVAA
jgi:hypothetical protein